MQLITYGGEIATGPEPPLSPPGEETYGATAGGESGPGVTVGPTSEFSLFFRVKPGDGESCGRRCRDLQDTPGYRPGTTGWRSRRSTRRGSCCSTTTRGWRSSRASTARGTPTWRTSSPPGRRWRSSTSIFRHAEGYDGLPDLAALKAFILSAQQTAAAYARNYGGTVKEIRKAQRVNAAFQQVLDHPDAAEALQHPALKPLLDEAAD